MSNSLSNSYNIEFNGEVSRESLYTYKQELQEAVFNEFLRTQNASNATSVRDQIDLHNVDKMIAEQERSTDVLLALQRLEDSSRTQFTTLVNTVTNTVTRLGEEVAAMRNEMRDNFNVVNYRLSVMENDALVRYKRSTINRIPFVVGVGPDDTLPPITDIHSINNMSEENVVVYLRGYGCDRLPNTLLAKKKRLAQMVGLTEHEQLIIHH